MARKKKRTIPKTLLLICIITGIATLILHIANRRLQISELDEIAGYVGTAFVISLIIILGIYIVKLVNK